MIDVNILSKCHLCRFPGASAVTVSRQIHALVKWWPDDSFCFLGSSTRV